MVFSNVYSPVEPSITSKTGAKVQINRHVDILNPAGEKTEAFNPLLYVIWND
jgi:hypothetical protein